MSYLPLSAYKIDRNEKQKYNRSLPESWGGEFNISMSRLPCTVNQCDFSKRFIWYKSPWVQIRGREEKNPIYKLCPRLLVAQHLNYPVSRFLFIHADKVTYSWGLTQKSLIDWQAQIAYFTIWGIADACTLRRLRESLSEEGLAEWAFGSQGGQFH